MPTPKVHFPDFSGALCGAKAVTTSAIASEVTCKRCHTTRNRSIERRARVAGGALLVRCYEHADQGLHLYSSKCNGIEI